MMEAGLQLSDLDLLAPGVTLPIREALRTARTCPPGSWPPEAYVTMSLLFLYLFFRCFNETSIRVTCLLCIFYQPVWLIVVRSYAIIGREDIAQEVC
jgi:hypothetical protein